MDYFSGLNFSMTGSTARHVDYVHNEPLYYGVQFNYHGPLRLQINNGREYRVEGSYAFLTHPGAVFRYGAINGVPRHHNFICTYGKRIEHYLQSGLFPLNADPPLVYIRNADKFLRTMLTIIELIRLPGTVSPRAVLLFEDLLLQMHEALRDEPRNPPWQATYLTGLIEQISARPEGAWDFQAEAARCHVTSTHFRRIFKEIAGMPPQQFLIQNRLRKAAQELIHTQEPVKTIAANAGFDNPFYFSRLFRQKYQASPIQYRREFTSNETTPPREI
jgi:AraC-like DNA-binding protein